MGGVAAASASIDVSSAGRAPARVHEVQGVLFALPEDEGGGTLAAGAERRTGGVEVDSRGIVRGYRGTVASKVAGITYRQLDYWARRRIVEPSVKASHGSGSRRLYSFKDVLVLAVSKRLLDVGVNLHNVTTAIGYLQGRTSAQLEGITIMCDGQRVYECTDDAQVGDLMKTGNAVFGVSVRSVWHRIHDALDAEPCEEVLLGRESLMLPRDTASTGATS